MDVRHDALANAHKRPVARPVVGRVGNRRPGHSQMRAHLAVRHKAPVCVNVEDPHDLVRNREDSQPPAVHRHAGVARQQDAVAVKRERVAYAPRPRADRVHAHVLRRAKVVQRVRVRGRRAVSGSVEADLGAPRGLVALRKAHGARRRSNNDQLLVVGHQAKVLAHRVAVWEQHLVQRLKERLRRAVAAPAGGHGRPHDAPDHNHRLRATPKAHEVAPRARREAPRHKAEVHARERVRRTEPRPDAPRVLAPLQRVSPCRPHFQILAHVAVGRARPHPLQLAQGGVAPRRVGHLRSAQFISAVWQYVCVAHHLRR